MFFRGRLRSTIILSFDRLVLCSRLFCLFHLLCYLSEASPLSIRDDREIRDSIRVLLLLNAHSLAQVTPSPVPNGISGPAGHSAAQRVRLSMLDNRIKNSLLIHVATCTGKTMFWLRYGSTPQNRCRQWYHEVSWCEDFSPTFA